MLTFLNVFIGQSSLFCLKNVNAICCPLLFSVDFFQNFEDLNEEIDNVQVELDGGQDVLFSAEPGHDHLGVHDDEQREEEGASHSQGGVSQLVTHKHLEEPAEDEDQEPGGEGGVHAREVTLGLYKNICYMVGKISTIRDSENSLL